MPTVSVIVPLYNKARYVGRALASISRQTFTDLEIIVVDDGSTDNGATVASRHADPRLKVVRQTNQGPGAARNLGIEMSASPLLAFLDADDEWLATYLEQGVRVISQAGTDAAAHTCTYIDEPAGRDSSRLWRSRAFQAGVHRVSQETSATALLHRVAFMSPCTTIVRADVVREVGGFYSAEGCRYAEDAHLWLRVLLHKRVSFSLEPHVRIHRNASHLSASTRVPRPLEPFLAHPEEIRGSCPPELMPLLDEFFAIRAFKTACAWAYWGQWRAARELMRGFQVPGERTLPFYWRARCAATPWGAAVGTIARGATRLLGRA